MAAGAVVAIDAFFLASGRGGRIVRPVQTHLFSDSHLTIEGAFGAGEHVVVVNYGGGTNSTALLVRMVKLGLRPQSIFCSDTGSERPEFYTYVPMFSSWLEAQGFPPIDIVRWRRKVHNREMGWKPGDFVALHEWCLDMSEMPSAAFGMAGCSTKWKGQPIDARVKRMVEIATSAGMGVARVFGFDADEPNRHKDTDPMGNVCLSPLIEWGMGRDECIDEIRSAGLPLPGKSSCFMCPHMRPPEIARLRRDHPDLFQKGLEIEARWLREGRRAGDIFTGEAASTTMGLGRRWAWADLPEAELDRLADVDEDRNDRPCGCMDG